MFIGFRKLLYSHTDEMCHSSTHPGTSLHVIQFYQAFPHVSTASDKHWGEKAWVRRPGYEAKGHALLSDQSYAAALCENCCESKGHTIARLMKRMHANCPPEILQLNCYQYLQVFKFQMLDITWYVIAVCRKVMNNVSLKIRAMSLKLVDWLTDWFTGPW